MNDSSEPAGGQMMGVSSATNDADALAIDVRSLGHQFPDGHWGLVDVDLQVRPGERVALLGPNGAGKSTLALHLNGILMPTAGRVAIHGQDVRSGQLAAIRQQVGLVFQDPDDQLFMPTVAQDVAFGPRNFGVPPDQIDARVQEALTAVGMSDAAASFPGHLSFGQRRRVAIATVLACRPDILVLDEPTSNLDPAARQELSVILAKLEVTVLIITHDLPFAAAQCPRSVVVADGRVVADGPTRVLLADAELLRQHRLDPGDGLLQVPPTA